MYTLETNATGTNSFNKALFITDARMIELEDIAAEAFYAHQLKSESLKMIIEQCKNINEVVYISFITGFTSGLETSAITVTDGL